MKNDELTEALAYDPMAGAERILGASYKEDESVAGLGILMMQRHNEYKHALLFLNRDTSHRNTLQQQLDVFKDLGFELLLCDDIPGTKDKFRIFWRPGILLCCDSYFGDKELNSGSIYFNFRGNREHLDSCTNGLAENTEDVWVVSRDVREGLRHCLDTLSENGQFLRQWVEQPFLWLLHYADTRGAYDSKAINAERISRLPEHVQIAILAKPAAP